MDDRVRFALEKLLNVAHEDSGQGRRVANFLLAWWNAEVHGGFDLTDLANVDLAHRRGHGDDLHLSRPRGRCRLPL